jgi:hypothetical protein
MTVSLPTPASRAAVASRGRMHAAALLIGLVLLIVTLAAAISIDVVRAGYGVKGDEATYVGMALSLAYDGDLAYEHRDLERFWGLYHQGPEGIFLKRGRRAAVALDGAPPFVHLKTLPDSRTDRAYFGKSMLYSIAAAPFVRIFGMNGFLVFHVVLLAIPIICGYLFLSAQTDSAAAILFPLAFVFASATPVQAVFFTPDLFNFSVVFAAYFLWLYKEVTPSSGIPPIATDIMAAVLLGMATYSKVTNAPLVLPLVLLPWIRRAWWRGLITGLVSVGACGALFLLTLAVTGDWNYQGGDRKQFYSAPSDPAHPAPPASGFPFDRPEGTWDVRGRGVGTDDLGAQDTMVPSEIVRLLPRNAWWFLVGRHFGLIPYFFPAVIAVLTWLTSRFRADTQRLLTFFAIVIATLVLLIVFPYTWSGGGGPPGNRYYMSIYPAYFFLLPPGVSALPALLAWTGGALFTAKMLVTPFTSAKNTWEITERGFARKLPVEVTMANDLPVMLAQPRRGGITYSVDPVMKLYFLDQHATPPEPDGMWIAGDGRADIIVRTENEVREFEVSARSPIHTVLTVSAGQRAMSVTLAPGTPTTFRIPAAGERGCCLSRRSYAYLVSAQSSEGFIPRLNDPSSTDDRNLGAQITLRIP